MSKQDNSGPAFPAPMIPCDNQGGYTEVRHTGMSLRDYFAAKAMQAMVGNLYESAHHPAIGAEVAKTFMCPNDCLLDTQAPTHPSHEEVGIHDDPVAFSAYRIADAMLRARKK